MDNIKKRLKVLQHIYFSTIKSLTDENNTLDYQVTFDICGDICSEILRLMIKLYTDYGIHIDDIIELTDMMFKSDFVALIENKIFIK